MSKHRIRTNNAYVYAKPSAIHNNGLFARTDITAGTEIVEYDGPRIKIEEGEELAEQGNNYIFRLDRKTAIEGSVKWNLARYANHSCDPNSKTVKSNGRIMLKTIKPVKKGEEITYNYGYDFAGYEKNPCNCGAASCVGFMVSEKFKEKVF